MHLGRLESVDLRTVWHHEAHSFTPWLAEEANLKLLSSTLGIDLELEGMERGVGPFSADILCKVTGNADHLVLIENQIERTDHTHLGQILTYAAGLHTATIVWIARRFTEEHRAALDWLNEITKEEISFFGLEIELWKINDSPPAPKFNIVSRPNEFVKVTTASSGGGSSSYAALYREYWSTFKDYVETHSSVLRCLKPQAEYWIDLAPLAQGIRLRAMAGARDKFNMVDLVIYNDPEKTKIGFLEQYRTEIDGKLPDLNWRPKPGYKESAIELRLNGPDPSNKSDWPQQHSWLLEKLEQMHSIFGPLVKQLTPQP